MKEGIHEGCIEQIQRLYQQRLFTGSEVPVDEKVEFVLMIGNEARCSRKNCSFVA
jgi:trans-2-enoyl-CoA reductase